jgi:hypothetical protein
MYTLLSCYSRWMWIGTVLHDKYRSADQIGTVVYSVTSVGNMKAFVQIFAVCKLRFKTFRERKK